MQNIYNKFQGEDWSMTIEAVDDANLPIDLTAYDTRVACIMSCKGSVVDKYASYPLSGYGQFDLIFATGEPENEFTINISRSKSRFYPIGVYKMDILVETVDEFTLQPNRRVFRIEEFLYINDTPTKLINEII